jgi:hypothetical protein
MKTIKTKRIPVGLKAPDHGGDPYAHPKDIDDGVAFVLPQVAQDDFAVRLEHNDEF